MPDITHVHSDEIAGDPTTSGTVVMGAGILTNDLLTVAAHNRGSTSEPTVTDNDTGGNTWALLGSRVTATGFCGVWWKRATSGTASKTITVGGCTDSLAGGYSAHRDVNLSATPYDLVTTGAQASGAETEVGFTTTLNGCMICLANFQRPGSSILVSSVACTSPGALTKRFEHFSSGGNDTSVCFSSGLQTTAGATGNFTWSQTNSATNTIAFALLPNLIAAKIHQLKQQGIM